MSEQIMQLISFAAPLLAGLMTSISIPSIIASVLVKYFKKKTNEISESKEIKELKEKIDFLSDEIMKMRGKKKWKNIQQFI